MKIEEELIQLTTENTQLKAQAVHINDQLHRRLVVAEDRRALPFSFVTKEDHECFLIYLKELGRQFKKVKRVVR